MIEKVLEAFFRHWLLILLPVIVIPLDVAASVLSTPPQYEASAGMWVEQATYLNYSIDDINRYLSPAQNQRNRLVELMQTRSFLDAVAKNTGLAEIAARPTGSDDLRDIFARDFESSATGDHLLTLKFRAESRDLALQVLSTIFTSFRTRAAADRYGQAQLAISFYQTNLSDAEATLATARADLAKFLAANVNIATTLSRSGVDVARADPQFAEAQRRVDAAQRDADKARESLDRAELDVSAGTKGFELSFRLADEPQASLTPSRQLKKALIYPIAALVFGVILSASLLFLFALSDHSIRSIADLAPDTVILGVLPHLTPEGVARRSGPAVTRRAVAFVAGAIVPLRGGKAREAS
ncbi:MAG TPA: hypothetical protein VI056_06520 [Candidatus Limnocylindria bacterium]